MWRTTTLCGRSFWAFLARSSTPKSTLDFSVSSVSTIRRHKMGNTLHLRQRTLTKSVRSIFRTRKTNLSTLQWNLGSRSQLIPKVVAPVFRRYQRVIGALIFITEWTRPDCLYATIADYVSSSTCSAVPEDYQAPWNLIHKRRANEKLAQEERTWCMG